MLGSIDLEQAKFKQGFGVGVGQLEGGGVIFDPYQKIIHFNKKESRAIGRAK